ncbi:putative bifunctional diguanylate cyclase/phosphodiesterase [Sulfurimonas autotrophica]|uniref:Diguanylate cyclase/phosphodiesterase n=1 Tax=Sulfurimonas autotrophica (strain ATCC BAA-671 / DSM 16294 / JCM 11897 / OK10) TaxID=563040 RepID=E0URN1_SULAO|nr:bifunctional diguanylate cyclase/phosphodiesterase [Sulfurimonas autotrophica]ADN08975.1 diguanylate cyclase/phosphodiesterase [Sulfurimonas autotrophica DSM 16294]
MKNAKLNRSFIMLAIVIPLVTLASIVIYIEFIKTKEHVFSVIKEHLVNQKIYTFQKYVTHIEKDYGDNLRKTIMLHPDTAKKLEAQLSLLQGEDVKYLYLLYRDKEHKYRYLLDTTKEAQDRAFFNQKFDTESDIWEKAYSTKKYQITQQNSLDKLWVTIAYPVVVNDNVVAVLGADFTYDVYTRIVQILKPMEDVFLYISFFMFIMLILAYVLVYLYYKTRKKAFIDPLTQVYNRQYLSEFLETTSLQNYYLMMIDLDNFKRVNDNYGHNIGDDVLVAVAQEIKSTVRQEDIVIRFGGEEFILLVDKKENKESIGVAERIRQAVMNLDIQSHDNQISMTLSIGVNPFPYSAKNMDEAIKIADEQLYVAKSSGRNRVEIFDDGKKYESEASNRISDIRLAIDEDGIKCAFQPIYFAKTGKIVKYEMLIRMINHEGKVIPPDSFLPSIRHTQIYIRLTSIVLQKAIETLQSMQDVHLSINLDIQDILNEDIIELLKFTFKSKQDLAQRVTIEILEHEEITNFEAIQKSISGLKELGFSIALDDFGSGYANFSYMMNLDLDILKIDGTIIKNIDKDKAAYNIVKAIVAFGRSMKMETVAEQIETKEEMDTLVELGVDCLQGYYLGRPGFKIL